MLHSSEVTQTYLKEVTFDLSITWLMVSFCRKKCPDYMTTVPTRGLSHPVNSPVFCIQQREVMNLPKRDGPLRNTGDC